MTRSMIAVPLLAALLLSGCSTTAAVDKGDSDACIDWATYEQGMIQTVSVIQEIAKNPKDLTEDVATEFNTARNNLLVAYESAMKTATSPEIAAALSTALDADSAIYFNLADATDEKIQESISAVGGVVAACLAAGVDLSTILGTSR